MAEGVSLQVDPHASEHGTDWLTVGDDAVVCVQLSHGVLRLTGAELRQHAGAGAEGAGAAAGGAGPAADDDDSGCVWVCATPQFSTKTTKI